jgi:GT2 family glycosyltransferase
VSIIVGVHNGVPMVKNCLQSIFQSQYKNFEVVCVDSGSTDGTVEYIEREFGGRQNVRVIGVKSNCGNARLYNIGAEAARNEILFFLDFDIELEPSCLGGIVEALNGDQSIGAAQAVVLDMRNKDRIQCAGMYMLDYCGWTWSFLKGARREALGRAFDTEVGDTGIASGTALAMRKSVFDKVGGFDDSFFMYFEETDISWRTWLAGYRVVVVTGSAIYHLGGDVRKYTVGYGLSRGLKSYHSQRNNFRMMLKNYGGTNLAKFSLTALAAPFLLRLYGLATEKDIFSMNGLIKAVLWNIRHLRETIRERSKVQLLVRKETDEYVLEHIARRLPLSSMLGIMELRRSSLNQTPLYSTLHKSY